MTPKAGQQWRKKREPRHVGTVVYVDTAGPYNGYVVLQADWSKRGEVRKFMDTFLKIYTPV